MQSFPIKDLWCVHSYYSLNPYAPDGSGRILISGCDLRTGLAQVLILDKDGAELCRFGQQKVGASFYHTGLWQAWGPEGKSVYYSCSNGDPLHPRVARRDLISGTEEICDGDMEGCPAFGEPICYGLHAMLYAAGYGTGEYLPALSPIPFARRSEHGLFCVSPRTGENRLLVSTEEFLHRIPDPQVLLREDAACRSRLGPDEGLTLMTYCVRYSRDGKRMLIHFGNHCVDKRRGEPHILYLFTANADGTGLRPILDLSFEKRGVHWSWQPDGEHLIGYGPRPDDPRALCLAEIRWDGTGYRMLSPHNSGGHASVSPANPQLAVTDETDGRQGYLVWLNTATGRELGRMAVPKYNFEHGSIPPGRNRYWICHHPVFDDSGKKLLLNTMQQGLSTVAQLTLD